MNAYQLSLITPDGLMFDNQVTSLVAPGSEGSLGVLASHAPLVTQLKQGILEIKNNSETTFFTIGEGILEIKDTHDVLILTDSAQKGQNLEEAKSKLSST